MQIKTYDGDESTLKREEKFSSFTEMLDLGWSMNHYKSKNDTLIGADLDEAIDSEIAKDRLSGAKLSDRNMQN